MTVSLPSPGVLPRRVCVVVVGILKTASFSAVLDLGGNVQGSPLLNRMILPLGLGVEIRRLGLQGPKGGDIAQTLVPEKTSGRANLPTLELVLPQHVLQATPAAISSWVRDEGKQRVCC